MIQKSLSSIGRWRRYGLVGLGACLAVNVVGADDFLMRLDAAVVAGSYPTLKELQAELGESPASDGAADVYLWAYTNWRLTQRLPAAEKKRRRRLLKSIQSELVELTGRQPGDAEAFALLGSVLGDRIDGALSAIRLGGRASEALERAYQLAPENPRVALQRGVGFYFTPRPFGGGLDKAQLELRRALDLYEAEPANEPWPNWGRLDALARLGQVLADLDRPAEARALYAAALRQAPDYVWVRDELLPALAAATP